MEAEPSQEVDKPLIVRDVVVSPSGDQLVLSFSEQTKYDPMLVVIMANFEESGPEGLVPIKVAPSSKWLSEEIGQMSDEDPQLLFEGIKGFKQLTVDLSYDAEYIETRVFDDKGKEIKNANKP